MYFELNLGTENETVQEHFNFSRVPTIFYVSSNTPDHDPRPISLTVTAGGSPELPTKVDVLPRIPPK
jgi:hypothetical protein